GGDPGRGAARPEAALHGAVGGALPHERRRGPAAPSPSREPLPHVRRSTALRGERPRIGVHPLPTAEGLPAAARAHVSALQGAGVIDLRRALDVATEAVRE